MPFLPAARRAGRRTASRRLRPARMPPLLPVLLPVLLLLALLGSGRLAPAEGRADDPPAAEPARASRQHDLRAYDCAPAVHGPLLAAPSDLLQEGGGTRWSLSAFEGGAEHPREAWVELEQPPLPRRAFASEALVEWLRADGLDDTFVELQAEEHRIALRGRPEAVAEAERRLLAGIEALNPSVRLDALLLDEGSSAGVRAQAGLSLAPGRWTRVWLQEQRLRATVDYDVEIAEETTIVQPVTPELPEGQELYVRWHPGVTRSLLEVWSGDLEHLDAFELDLSVLRNLPEASGPGRVRLPRTALARAYTALVVPAAGGTQDLVWRGPAGTRRLVLTLGALPPVPGTRERPEPGVRSALLRVGALAGGLGFESRAPGVDPLREQLLAAAGPEGTLDLRTLPGSGALFLAGLGSAADVQAARQELVRLEQGLLAADLSLQVWTVPEEAVRALLQGGQLRPGRPLPDGLAAALRAAGALEGEALRLPVLAGAHAGFRTGASVAGLAELQVEVAQRAGATDPVCGAAFQGLAGEVRVTAAPAGLRAELSVELAWADPRGGTASLTFRPPVGVRFSEERPQPEPESVRRVELPLLSTGTATSDLRLEEQPADAPERLLAVGVRGSDAWLLVGRLVRRP